MGYTSRRRPLLRAFLWTSQRRLRLENSGEILTLSSDPWGVLFTVIVTVWMTFSLKIPITLAVLGDFQHSHTSLVPYCGSLKYRKEVVWVAISERWHDHLSFCLPAALKLPSLNWPSVTAETYIVYAFDEQSRFPTGLPHRSRAIAVRHDFTVRGKPWTWCLLFGTLNLWTF